MTDDETIRRLLDEIIAANTLWPGQIQRLKEFNIRYAKAALEILGDSKRPTMWIDGVDPQSKYFRYVADPEG